MTASVRRPRGERSRLGHPLNPSLASTNFGDLVCAFFIEPDLVDHKVPIRQYHSDLCDQSALEIRVSIRARLIKVALF